MLTRFALCAIFSQSILILKAFTNDKTRLGVRRFAFASLAFNALVYLNSALPCPLSWTSRTRSVVLFLLRPDEHVFAAQCTIGTARWTRIRSKGGCECRLTLELIMFIICRLSTCLLAVGRFNGCGWGFGNCLSAQKGYIRTHDVGVGAFAFTLVRVPTWTCLFNYVRLHEISEQSSFDARCRKRAGGRRQRQAGIVIDCGLVLAADGSNLQFNSLCEKDFVKI